MDVGVRELKEHLSDYLQRVAAGETITVTDRGRPKALLVPIAGEATLQKGIDEGWIRAPERTGLGVARRFRASRRVLDQLGDDRAEDDAAL